MAEVRRHVEVPERLVGGGGTLEASLDQCLHGLEDRETRLPQMAHHEQGLLDERQVSVPGPGEVPVDTCRWVSWSSPEKDKLRVSRNDMPYTQGPVCTQN